MADFRIQFACKHWTTIDLPTAEQAAGAQKVAECYPCGECWDKAMKRPGDRVSATVEALRRKVVE